MPVVFANRLLFLRFWGIIVPTFLQSNEFPPPKLTSSLKLEGSAFLNLTIPAFSPLPFAEKQTLLFGLSPVILLSPWFMNGSGFLPPPGSPLSLAISTMRAAQGDFLSQSLSVGILLSPFRMRTRQSPPVSPVQSIRGQGGLSPSCKAVIL